MLEKKSAELTWDPTWVFMTLLEIGIPFPVLHGIYDRLFKAKVNKDMSYVICATMIKRVNETTDDVIT